MKTKQIGTAAVTLTLIATLVSASAFAKEAGKASKEERRGAIAGTIIGATIAGPFGAGVGAMVGGGLIGKLVGESRARKELEIQLAQQIDSDKRQQQALTETVAELNDELDRLTQTVSVDTGWNPTELPIQFRTDSSDIEDHYRIQLNEIADVLNGNKSSRINLLGFADRRGSKDYNQKLSARRIAQVRIYLISKGVGSNQIVSTALGETRPLSPVENFENNFFDRRVVMQFANEVNPGLVTR